MSKKTSSRCGNGKCRYYDPTNHTSKCSIYDDRRKCAISNQQRRKVAYHSKQTAMKPFGV